MKKLKKALGASIMLAALAILAMPAGAVTSTMTVTQATKSGVAPTRVSSGLVASTQIQKFRNDGKTFLLFEKTGAGECTVTIVTPNTVGGIAVADVTVTVPATTGDKVVGPFPTRIFNDSAGDMTFTVSDTVGLSIAVLRL